MNSQDSIQTPIAFIRCIWKLRQRQQAIRTSTGKNKADKISDAARAESEVDDWLEQFKETIKVLPTLEKE